MTNRVYYTLGEKPVDIREEWQSGESDDGLIDALASSIVRRGLTTPAILLFELFKPFSFLGSQALLFIEPLFEPFMRGTPRRYAELLEDRHNIEHLLEKLTHTVTCSTEGGG